MNDGITHKTEFLLEKFRVVNGLKYPVPYAVERFEKNLGLNEGLNVIASLICGGAGTPYDSANAYIGVGDSTTTAAASQTGLQAPTNKAYAGMEAGYPTFGTNQQIVWRASFADGEAQFAWNEFTIENANLGLGAPLLRKVESKGTKTAGEIWELTVTVTFS
jgi:hypothetical protein